MKDYNLLQFQTVLLFAIVFTLGWVTSNAFDSINTENPTNSIISNNFIGVNVFDKASPSDIIPQENIHVYNDKIIIEVDNPEWAMFTDTNSMDPVLDKGANALQIIPKNEEQIQVGDIISFTTDKIDGTIIHRVIETGYDDSGWYAFTKGDNNPEADTGKRRFSDVKKLLIGIIY